MGHRGVGAQGGHTQLRKGPQAHVVEVAKDPTKGYPLVINAVELTSSPAEPHPVKRVLAFEPPRKKVSDSPGGCRG